MAYSKEERIKIGDEAEEKIRELFFKETGKEILRSTKARNYIGEDGIHPDTMVSIDFKNNQDSYVWQYSISGNKANTPNPYKDGCVTGEIWSLNGPQDNYIALSLPEYWAKFYKDVNCIPDFKKFLNGLTQKCTIEEYKKLADLVETELRKIIKPNIEIVRLEIVGRDHKIFLRVKPKPEIPDWRELIKKHKLKQ